jgi:hypothetical protein
VNGPAFLFVLGTWGIVAVMHRWSSAIVNDWTDMPLAKDMNLKSKCIVVYFFHGLIITAFLYGVIHQWGSTTDDFGGALKLGILLFSSFALILALIVLMNFLYKAEKNIGEKYPLSQGVEMPRLSLPQLPKLGLKGNKNSGGGGGFIGKPGDFDETLLD